MKTLVKHLGVAAMIAGFTQAALAVPQLRIFDGTTTLTISDNGVGDMQGAAGQVVWVGSIGNWTLNVHTGTSFPAIGTLSNPILDLAFNATSGGAGGTLQISFSVDGFGPTNGTALTQIGGTIAAGSSLTFNTYGGTNNTNFSTVNLLTSQGPFGGGAFSGTMNGGVVNNAGPYSLTELISITHGAGTLQTTGDAMLTVPVPDSGLSILLLGTGLIGVGLMTRIRHRVG